MNDVIVTDNCDANPSVIFKDVARKKGICAIDGYTILLHCTWMATDKCGNTSQLEIFIKIIDNTPPKLYNVPSDTAYAQSAQLIADSSKLKAIYTIDGCDDKPTVVLTEQKTDSLVTRTWTATDACGNFSKASQFSLKVKSIALSELLIPRLIELHRKFIFRRNYGRVLIRLSNLVVNLVLRLQKPI